MGKKRRNAGNGKDDPKRIHSVWERGSTAAKIDKAGISRRDALRLGVFAIFGAAATDLAMEFQGYGLFAGLKGAYHWLTKKEGKDSALERHLGDTRTIDEKLNDSSVSIGYLALDILKDGGLGVKEEDYITLEKIIDRVKTNAGRKETYTPDEELAALSVIKDVLTVFGFRYSADTYIIPGLRKMDRIDCDSFAIIYLACAQAINLPVHGTIGPGHSLVCTDTFYWDGTVNNNHKKTREGLIHDLNIANKSITNGAYLRPLTNREFLAVVYLTLGLTSQKQKDLDRSIAYYKKAMELNPKLPEAYLNLGAAQADMRDFVSAEQNFRKALELDSRSSEGYHGLGVIEMHNGNIDQAIDDFSKAIDYYSRALDFNARYFPSYYLRSGVYYNKGKSEIRQGKVELGKEHLQLALDDLNTAIEVWKDWSNDPQIYEDRGNVLKELGRIEDANKDFEMYRILIGGK